MALSELVHNAVEHGYDAEATGEVTVRVDRSDAGRMVVQVVDDGRGLPAGFSMADSDRLGLQIVRTLVEGELNGQLSIGRREPRGTIATIDGVSAAARP
jgi:two-component sensor histidine kinase